MSRQINIEDSLRKSGYQIAKSFSHGQHYVLLVKDCQPLQGKGQTFEAALKDALDKTRKTA